MYKDCKNCEFAKVTFPDWVLGCFSYEFARCTNQNSQIFGGKPLFCSNERKSYDDIDFSCGPEAKWFEPKK